MADTKIVAISWIGWLITVVVTMGVMWMLTFKAVPKYKVIDNGCAYYHPQTAKFTWGKP